MLSVGFFLVILIVEAIVQSCWGTIVDRWAAPNDLPKISGNFLLVAFYDLLTTGYPLAVLMFCAIVYWRAKARRRPSAVLVSVAYAGFLSLWLFIVIETFEAKLYFAISILTTLVVSAALLLQARLTGKGLGTPVASLALTTMRRSARLRAIAYQNALRDYKKWLENDGQEDLTEPDRPQIPHEDPMTRHGRHAVGYRSEIGEVAEIPGGSLSTAPATHGSGESGRGPRGT